MEERNRLLNVTIYYYKWIEISILYLHQAYYNIICGFYGRLKCLLKEEHIFNILWQIMRKVYYQKKWPLENGSTTYLAKTVAYTSWPAV